VDRDWSRAIRELAAELSASLSKEARTG